MKLLNITKRLSEIPEETSLQLNTYGWKICHLIAMAGLLVYYTCHVVIPDRSLVLHVSFDAESRRNGIPSNGISEPIDLSVERLGLKCPSHSLIFLYELRYRYC